MTTPTESRSSSRGCSRRRGGKRLLGDVAAQQGQSGHTAENTVSAQQRYFQVHGSGRDPQIVRMATVMKGMPDLTAGETQTRDPIDQTGINRNNVDPCDRRFEPLQPLRPPSDHQCAIAQLGDSLNCQDDLMTDHPGSERCEVGPRLGREAGAEHTGVDNDDHKSSASRNARYSSSVRPSITSDDRSSMGGCVTSSVA